MTEAQRLALLSQTYLFGVLPEAARMALASAATLRCTSPGEFVLRQEETAEAVFVVVSGRGEESVREGDQAIPVALVSRGEVIGEEALRRPDRSYGSSVRALDGMEMLAIPLAAVQGEAGADALQAALARDAETLDRVTFVKRATPFAILPPMAARRLAADLSLRNIEAGEHLVREGEVGEACYLIRKGRFAIRSGAGQTLRQDAKPIVVLEPGELIGEVALLAGEPHRASVVALEPGEVLVLRRSALIKALAASHDLSAALTVRARLRVRPTRADGIERHELTRADGETTTILKDAGRGAYFRLSELGAFVWDRLDGTRTVRTLVIEWMTRAHRFAPAAIAEVVAGLIGAGFARTNTDAVSLGLSSPSRTARGWAQGLHRFLVHTIAERDRWLAPVTTRTAVFNLAGVCLAGLALIGAGLIDGWDGGDRLPSWTLATLFFAISLVCHEIGHALAMKSLGRTVNGYWIGWHWLIPFAYVDTTDAWLAPPVARAAIALAGPFANLVLASLAAMIAIAVNGELIPESAWLFTAVNVLLCVAALSPAGENDGAQALEEWLGPRTMPHTQPFRSALTTLGGMMTGRTIPLADIGAALALVLHTGAFAGTVFVGYHLTFQDAVAGIAGEQLALTAGIADGMAAAFVMAEGATAASLDR
jgi:CRP-like cAMP-binding protein/Zn-dependent protease